jgi:cytochrome c556
MRKWSVALAVIALMATAMALYVQLFERGPSREEERLAAARQKEDALAESRLKAEIQARHRQEEAALEPPGDGPLPGAVLRRSESGRGSALEQVRDDQEEQRAAMTRLLEELDALTLQVDRSDRAVRRDLEALRAEVQRERNASGKVQILLLVALVPLVLHLLISVWPPGQTEGDEGHPPE